jgi:cytochrome c oxidase cbb3-type subunit 3
LFGYSQRTVVAGEVNAARAAQAQFRDMLASTPLDRVKADPDLLRFAMAGGSVAFQTNCAPCHGRGAQGFAGYPNLNDDDWLWGGAIEDIHKTVAFGVRSDHKDTRAAQMPRYGLDKLLEDGQINDAAEYVLSFTGKSTNPAAAARGEKVFADQCASCHGSDGKGKQDQGAPNLADEIWLYGGSKQAVVESIRTGRGGMMPAWSGRLDPVTLKSLAVYVHSLGGGK